MASEIRERVWCTMERYSNIIVTKGKKVLEVGIAGDPKPGGNYNYFGKDAKQYKTLDNVSDFQPDFVQDICGTDFEDESWDIIILSQTLEHIPDMWMATSECHRILKSNGYLIVDAPFTWPYHAEPEFGDYWRVTPDGMKHLLQEFSSVDTNLSDNILTTAIARK